MNNLKFRALYLDESNEKGTGDTERNEIVYFKHNL